MSLSGNVWLQSTLRLWPDVLCLTAMKRLQLCWANAIPFLICICICIGRGPYVSWHLHLMCYMMKTKQREGERYRPAPIEALIEATFFM